MARLTFTLPTIKVYVLGFSACCFASLIAENNNHMPPILSRQRRLSVLNIIYRKGNNSEGGTQVFGRPHYNVAKTTTTTLMMTPTPRGERFTVAPSEITATIAKLRTTRLKFLMTTTPSHFPGENSPPPSTSPTTLDIPRRFPLDNPLNFPGGEFAPFYPSVNPRNSNPDRTKEPKSTTSRTTSASTRPSKPETFNPSFHELMPRTTTSRSQTPSPTFQARLNINPEKKSYTSPSRGKERETTTTITATTVTPVVTASPANVNCHGKIGYFSDMVPDCNSFLYCDQFGRAFKFMCPTGTKFNPRMCLCDLHSQCSSTGPLVSTDDPCPPLY